MDSGLPPVCFHCGQPTESSEDGPRLNRVDDGTPCPACAERLLEDLPSLVSDVVFSLAEAEEIESDVAASGEDEFLPDEPA